MPEIWLKYGNTDVVLDIKFENLLAQVSPDFKTLTEEEIAAALDSVPLSDNMLFLVLSPSKSSAKIVTILIEKARAQGIPIPNITIDVPAFGASLFRLYLPEGVSINRIDYQSIHDRIKKFQGAILVSHTLYDPLFGFAGSPTALARNFFPSEMSQAFSSRSGNKPAPGIIGSPLKIAIAACQNVSAYCIEIVSDSSGIASIHNGSIADEAFQKAISHLTSISSIESDQQPKSAIFSASSEAISHLTLAGSLNSLWNCIHAVKENGSAVLLAENRNGIGGGALQMYIEGRLKPEQLHQTLDAPQYIDGMEHLMYIEEMRQKYDLGIVSTLPQYYSKSKLGFATYAGMRDVLEKLLARNGKSHKILIVSDADTVLLRPREQSV